MDWIINFGGFLLFFISGLVVGTLMLSQIVLSISYGAQLSVRLRNLGLLKDNRPLKRYLLSFAVYTILSIIIAFVLFEILNLKQFIAFLIGAGFGSFRLVGDMFRHGHANFEDYLRRNLESFTRDPKAMSDDEISRFCNLGPRKDIEGNQLFIRVFGDLISNSLTFGFLTFLALGLGRVSWWLGIVVAGVLLLMSLVSVLQSLVNLLLTPIALIGVIFSKDRGQLDEHGRVIWKEQLWLTLALLPRLAEIGIDLFFLSLLYRFFF
jgi:hypothetical protein